MNELKTKSMPEIGCLWTYFGVLWTYFGVPLEYFGMRWDVFGRPWMTLEYTPAIWQSLFFMLYFN
jgi:hypothetical protein